MADVAEAEWRGKPIWLIVFIFIAKLVNAEERPVANYSAVPRHPITVEQFILWPWIQVLFGAAMLSFHFIFVDYFFSSWASNRYWGKNAKYLSSEVLLMGHLLIFDWKLKFFNENKIVAWSRIVLFIKYSDSGAGPCSQESLAPIS